MTKKILRDSKRSIEIKMASTCDMAWDELAGDNAKRFCSQCNKHVFNVSNMSGEQAIDFLIQENGKACIMFYSRRDGTVLSADCPVGVQKRYARWRPIRKMVFGVLSLLSFGQSYAANSVTLGGPMWFPPESKISESEELKTPEQIEQINEKAQIQEPTTHSVE